MAEPTRACELLKDGSAPTFSCPGTPPASGVLQHPGAFSPKFSASTGNSPPPNITPADVCASGLPPNRAALTFLTGPLSPDELERRISGAYEAMTCASSATERRRHWARMKALIAQRSPETIAHMERERGLRE